MLAIALVILAQSSDRISGDLDELSFVGKFGLIAGTYPTEETNYNGDYFYAHIPSLRFRNIGKFAAIEPSGSGRYFAAKINSGISTEGKTDNRVTILEFPSCRRVCFASGRDIGSFDEHESHFAWPGPLSETSELTEDLLICRLRDGHIRRLKKFRDDITHYAPKNARAEYFDVGDWNRRGIEIRITYATTAYGHSAEVYQSLYVDSVKDRITGRVPITKNELTKFKLPDGSFVYDELADDEVSMEGETRIVRVSHRKKTILFAHKHISAGHEMSADLRVSEHAMKVLVFGVDENTREARIWQINPLTRKRSLVASGAYNMPPWADGDSMFVEISSDGKWIAYGDFRDHRKIRLKRLP